MAKFMIFIVLVLVGVYFFWWLPQKWNACGTLYENVPAQIMCFSQGGD